MTIAEAEEKGLLKDHILLTDSQDVKIVAEHIGKIRTFKRQEIGGVFVDIADGEYISVYGFWGSVPYNDKVLVKFK